MAVLFFYRGNSGGVRNGCTFDGASGDVHEIVI